MERELEELLKAIEEHQPLTPAQLRIIRQAVARVFREEGWKLPRSLSGQGEDRED